MKQSFTFALTELCTAWRDYVGRNETAIRPETDARGGKADINQLGSVDLNL